jgi:nucleoside-diphosphate-sugar epimerase
MKALIIGGTGYIGSRLADYLHNSGYTVQTVDLEWFGSHPSNFKKNYRDLPPHYLNSFDAVIHLAGHSSVPACDKDPIGSESNNCRDFFKFVQKLDPSVKFIYASSGSVYGSSGQEPVNELYELPKPTKLYDEQKQRIDKVLLKNEVPAYGLRFGTVCGYSEFPRNELMINSMVRSIKTRNSIRVSNPGSFRAVLGMGDLCQGIKALLESDAPYGVYNMASFNMSIGEIASAVSKYFEKDVFSTEMVESESNYSFSLDTSKFTKYTGYRFSETASSIAERSSGNNFNEERQWIQYS